MNLRLVISVCIFLSILGALAKSSKARVTFVMSVRLSVCISAVPTERVYAQLSIVAFFENLSRN